MTAIPKISARFETTLASSFSNSASSFSLTNVTDKAGNALSGLYGFVIDNGSSAEEFVVGTVSGTIVTIVTRGCDPGTPTSNVPALQQSHRKGASVKISDYAILGYIRELLNGNFTFDNKLLYTSHPTFVNPTELIDKKYVDDIAISGGVNASTSVKGISTLSVAPVSPTSPIAVGDNDGRVPHSRRMTLWLATQGLQALLIDSSLNLEFPASITSA
jgi:hypothetical protein